MNFRRIAFVVICLVFATVVPAGAQTASLAIRGETVHTMTGEAIKDGVVLVRGDKIEKVGKAADVQIPAGVKVLQAKVVTPGLIDARTIVGLQGFRNEPREQDQLERSAPVQPELRAVDAYNGREKLVEYVRGFGVTTIHTGPQAGALVPGQTMIIKTRGSSADDGLLSPSAMLTITLGEGGIAGGAADKGGGDKGGAEKGKAPGTRSKQLAMLRAELTKAQEYDRKRSKPAAPPADASAGKANGKGDAKADESLSRDLRTEVFVRALHKELPVLITAHRAQDILSALKLAKEFDLKMVLDGASEAYLMIDQIKAAGVPVILHPTMYRSHGEMENLSMETASKLHAAGIRVALESGYEGYVPKTRVVLFEAAMAASNGLKFDDALATITSDAAKILGIDARVGTLAAGKDADIALYDGDPFEFSTHCIGVVLDGRVLSDTAN